MTGASSGIGESFVRQLATAGIPVVAVARRADRLEALAAELPAVEVLVADLETEAGVAAVCRRMAAGDLDLVVNNAGFGTSGRFVELDVDRLAREIALNVEALVRISHSALSVMTPKRRGWLLNVSSVASFQAAPGLAVYGATKSFVTTFTEALATEQRGSGVRITALCPGLTRTEFQEVSSAGPRSDRFPDFAWQSSAQVAAAGLDAVVDGRPLCIPGWFNRTLVGVSSALPRSVVRRIASLNDR